MSTRKFQRSFSGGEMSPSMFGQIDDAKFQTGLALCRNFIVTPQGPLRTRPGTEFVRAVKDSTKKVRLIKFVYDTTQSMVVEMGEGYFRFHTNGATLLSGGVPYEIANPYIEADLPDIRYVQSGDVLTMTHSGYDTHELRRHSATVWSFDTVDFAAPIDPPVSCTATATTTDAKYDYDYAVTAIAPDGLSESLVSTPGLCRGNVFESGGYNTITWPQVTSAIRYQVYKKVCGVYGYIGSTVNLSVVDDNIAADLSITPPLYDNTFSSQGILSVPVTGQGADYGTAYSGGVIVSVAVENPGSGYTGTVVTVIDSTGHDANITATLLAGHIENFVVANGGSHYTAPTVSVAGDGADANAGAITFTPYTNTVALTVTDSTGSGAELSAIVAGGKIIGVTVIKPGSGYTAPVVSVLAAAGGAGATFGTPALNTAHPAAVSYYEQRRVFGGGSEYPLNLWMTKSGTEKNMSYSLPTRDSDRIAVRMAALESGSIRHIVPLSQLLVLTSEAEYKVTSVNSDAITPISISVKPQSYIGASIVQPAIVNTSLLFCAARGGHVRELGYNWQANGFITGDLSLRAAHLFDNYDIDWMAFSKAPQPLMWMGSTSGKMLGLTYIPEQQIGAWHQHDTLHGEFESGVVVPEGVEDRLYVVVNRTINGATVRYIERMAPLQFTNKADAFQVDCGLTYSGTAVSTLTGLDHLEGETVSILADGVVLTPRVVTSGAITLDMPAALVHAGLQITSDMLTLPLAQQTDFGLGQGRPKNINKAWIRVYRSCRMFIGPDEDHLTEAGRRTNEPYGSSPALKTEMIPVLLTPSWAEDGSIFIRQTDPLPLTIVGLVLEVVTGG